MHDNYCYHACDFLCTTAKGKNIAVTLQLAGCHNIQKSGLAEPNLVVSRLMSAKILSVPLRNDVRRD